MLKDQELLILDCIQKKAWDKARSVISKASPQEALFYSLLLSGSESAQLGHGLTAERNYRTALIRSPKDWMANLLYAKYLISVGFAKDALPYAKTAFTESGHRVDATLMYIHSLLDSGDLDGIIDLTSRIKGDQAETRPILLARTSAFRAKKNFNEARKGMRKLLKKHPDDITVLRLNADIEADLDSKSGLELYKQAIVRSMDLKGKIDVALMWNSSLHFLRSREFNPGWEYWEAGFNPEVGTMGRLLPEQLRSSKRFDIKNFEPNYWTLVVPEQGIGDQVLFLSALSDFQRINNKLLLITDHRLKPIIERSFPDLQVTSAGLIDHWDQNGLKNNGFIPYGSLPVHTRPTIESFAVAPQSWLKPNSEKVNKYRESLEKLAGGRKIIGISWKGGFWTQQKLTKGLTLTDWIPYLKDEYFYVSLQYGDVSKEIADINAQKNKTILTRIDGIDFKQDIDSWFALICTMDHMISVSTAAVHFAGAAGRPVSVIMPDSQGPWILGLHDVKHLAYTNVNIYRKERQESLDNVFKMIYRRLDETAE